MLELEEYQLAIIPCRETVPLGCQDIYEKTYHLWHNVWSKTLKELDGLEHLPSNEFTRYDFAFVLLKNNEPISMGSFMKVDMKLRPRRKDSWFECWPKDFLEREAAREGLGLVASWYCTDENFRMKSGRPPFHVALTMMEMSSLMILEKKYNVIYGVTRNNRSVGKYAQKTGSVHVATSNAHGCEVDLVLWEPEKILKFRDEFSPESKYLWDRRLDYINLREVKNERITEENIRKIA